MSKCLFLFLAFILSVNCIKEETKNIILSQIGIRVKTIGKKGTAVIMYRQEEQIQVFKDAKKKPSFDSTISNQGKTYSIKCGVFNGRENSEYIYMYFVTLMKAFLLELILFHWLELLLIMKIII